MNLKDFDNLKTDLDAQLKNLEGLVSGFKNDINNFDTDKKTIEKLKDILNESLKGNAPNFTEIKNILDNADGVNNSK